MMKTNTHEETLPESAKKTSVKVAPTCRSVAARQRQQGSSSRAYSICAHICGTTRAAQTIERRGFPAGLLLPWHGYDASDVGR